MAQYTCEQCGDPFTRDACGKRPIRFCCSPCYNRWQREHRNAGQFSAGQEPWNKNLKGIHLSPASEFQKGMESINRDEVGTIKFRRDKGKGSPRAWVKIADPNVWKLRATINWEAATGQVLPKGGILHHVDEDTTNDEASNLQFVDRGQHLVIHRPKWEHKRMLAARMARWGW